MISHQLGILQSRAVMNSFDEVHKLLHHPGVFLSEPSSRIVGLPTHALGHLYICSNFTPKY